MNTREDPGNGFSQQCSSCDAPSFRSWCLDCQEALCEDCVSAHRRVSITRSHRLLNQPPAEGSSNPPTKFCRLHPSEPLKLFCFTCNQLTCRDCQLTTHMNHRYEFVSEALDGLKKQLEDQVDPIRARRDTMKRTLQDMETRVKDIVQNESCLKVQLHQSYDAFLQHLQKRKENLIEEIQKVHQSELDWIHMRMAQMRELHKSLQAVTDAADDAKSTNDLMSLQTYRAQIESLLKNLPGLNLPLPKLIPQMKVVTDSNSLMTVLNFGNLEISWVPFSVSSPQDPDPPDTCSVLPPTTITGLQSTHGLQTETSNDSGLAAPVQSTAASSSGHQCPSTCSSFVPSSTSTSASTARSPSSASRPPLQTVSCSSGAPANLPPPGQLWLLPPSSVLTGFSSAAPPSSTCAKHQTTGLNATTEQCWDTHLSSLQKYVNKKPLPPRSFDSSMSLFTVTQPDSKAVCQTGTSNSVLLSSAAPSSSSLCSTSGSFSISSPFIPAQPISTLQPNQSSSLNSPQSVPVGSHQPPSPSQNQPAVILLYRSTLLPPLPQPSRRGYTVTVQAAPVLSSAVTVPSVTAENQIFVGPSPKAQSNQTVVELSPQPVPSGTASSPQPVPSGREPHPQPIPSGTASSPQPVPSGPEPHPQPIPSGPEPHPVPSGPASSPQPVPSDFTPDSSSLEHEDLSHVVKAVADSACDHGMQQVEMKQQEPAENEPTSTMCEETEPLQSRSETANSDSEDPSGPGQQDSRLSQWQPKVCLFRLPLPPPPPGCPLPTYRLARGFAKDGIYLEEMRDNCESHANESTPESPVTLQLVSCSACGCADGSIICFSCGRGYHRDCHLPPVGPDFWSEWICSLCQDLSDSSDPYSSVRPRPARSPCLSLLNQRRCESLLLYLKVKGCSRLPQSHLKMMAERLSRRRAAYVTAAEFLSDSWTLFKQASSSPLLEDDPLSSLQRSFHRRLVKTFGAELHPSLLTPPNPRSNPQHPNKDARTESKLRETRKRLGQFLVLMGTSAAKRTKKDTMQS